MANAFIPYGAGQSLTVYFQFRRGHLLSSDVFSCTRRLVGHLSAAGLAMMPAAALPVPQLDKVVTEHQVQFAMQRHGNRHVGEEGINAGHFLLQCSMRKR